MATQHYSLPQWIAGTTLDFLGTMNGAFATLDTTIYNIDQTAQSAETTAGNADTKADNALTLANGHTTQISALQGALTTLTTTVNGLVTTVGEHATAIGNILTQIGTGNISALGNGTITGAILALKALIDGISGGDSGTDLWVNPSPTATFPATVVTLSANISGFSKYEVLYRYGADTNDMFTTGKILSAFGTWMTFVLGTIRVRGVSISGTSATFTGGTLYATYAVTTADNTKVIPYKIIGWR